MTELYCIGLFPHLAKIDSGARREIPHPTILRKWSMFLIKLLSRFCSQQCFHSFLGQQLARAVGIAIVAATLVVAAADVLRRSAGRPDSVYAGAPYDEDRS